MKKHIAEPASAEHILTSLKIPKKMWKTKKFDFFGNKIIIDDGDFCSLLSKISEVNKGIFDGKPGSPNIEWWEKKIFNESRLYDALGKEDARSVLVIWHRYIQTIKLLREIEKGL